MTRDLILAFTAITFLTAGAALALDEKSVGVQHADISRARAALDVLSPDQRAQAEFLLDEARAAINNRGDNANPGRFYNQVVKMVNEAERTSSFAGRQ